MQISLNLVSGSQSASWLYSGRGRTRDLCDYGTKWILLEPKHPTISSTSPWTQPLKKVLVVHILLNALYYYSYWRKLLVHNWWKSDQVFRTSIHTHIWLFFVSLCMYLLSQCSGLIGIQLSKQQITFQREAKLLVWLGYFSLLFLLQRQKGICQHPVVGQWSASKVS